MSFPEAVQLAGLVGLTVGAYLLHPVAAVLVGSAFLVLVGLALDPRVRRGGD